MPAPPSKRRKVANPKAAAPVQEITFDLDARHDYLTGFHKRKLQRAKHAQEIAERKAKEEKREQRKKMREDRHAQFQEALAEHRKRMDELNASSDNKSGSGDESAADEEEEEWNGIAEPPPVDYEAEYIDEDKYTTVTVEEIDPSKGDGHTDYEEADRAGKGEEGLKADGDRKEASSDKANGKKRIWTKENPNGVKKKKKFKYENKAERKVSRIKERQGSKKHAKERRSG